MYKSDISRDAAEVLNRDAVQFSSNLRYNDQKAYPFWYGFIPYPYDQFDSLNNGQGLLGITIPPGGIVDIPIVLERDSAYRQLNLRYTAFRYAPGAGLTGTITTAAGSTAVVGVATVFTTELIAGQPIMWLDAVTGLYDSGVVASITNNTNLVLETAAVNISAGVPFFRRVAKWYDTVPNTQNAAYANLSGTITIAAGTNSIDGVGPTAFGVEAVVGDVIQVIDASGITRNFMIATVAAASGVACATITETLGAADPGIAGGSVFQLVGNIIASAGTVTATVADSLITGAGGATFTTDVTLGDLLYYPDASGIVQRVHADAIISDLLLKVTNIPAASGAAVNMAIGVHSADRAAAPRNLLKFRPLTDFIRATVSMTSLRGRYLYGGLQDFGLSGLRGNQTGGLQERRQRITVLQGINDGMGMLRTESLYPFEGHVLVTVENNYSEPVLINGNLFGYKIVIEE